MSTSSGQPSALENRAAMEKEDQAGVVAHPRQHMPDWKWKGAFGVFVLTSVISGKSRQPVRPHVFTFVPGADTVPGADRGVITQPPPLLPGYDVSNVANIQPRLYEAFGNIKLLPWIGLSYSLANFAVLSFARKITYCFDLRYVYLFHMVIFLVGAVVAGAAKDLTSIIVGRVIMGWGGSVVQQT